MTDFTQTTVRASSCELELRTAGTGPALWYLHDEVTQALGAVPAALAERARVLAPVLPGFAGSPRPDWAETAEDVADLVLDLIDEVTPDEPVILVGASVGGWIAANAAIDLGRRVSSLVLVSPAGLFVPEEPPADHWFMLDADRDRTLFADPAKKPEVDTDEQYWNDSMLARLGWSPRLASKRLGHRLHRISAPTLVVWGAEDRLLPPSYAQRWADHLQDAAVEIVPGAGHFPGLEQPAVVNAAVRGFLDRHDANLPEVAR